MELIFSCSSEDTEFIDLVKKTFSSNSTITETKISGITGYEMISLGVQILSLTAAVVVPFVIANMTKNKDDRVKSKRCLIVTPGKILDLEGYDEDAVVNIVDEILPR